MQPAAASAALPSQRAGVAAALRHVVQREGLRALWKGNGVTIIHRLPYSSANFWVYEQVRLLRCCCLRRWSAPRHLPSCSAPAAGLSCWPVELIDQLHANNSSINTRKRRHVWCLSQKDNNQLAHRAS